VRQYELLLKLSGKLEDYYKIKSKLVVSVEAMYHLSEQVNRRNLRVWDSENARGEEKGQSKYQGRCVNIKRRPVRVIFLLVESAIFYLTYYLNG